MADLKAQKAAQLIAEKRAGNTVELPIRKRGEVVKVFTCEKYDVTFGVLEDLVGIAENINGVKDVYGMINVIRGLMLDVFPDMTKEDIRNATVNDIYRILQDLMVYALQALGGGEGN